MTDYFAQATAYGVLPVIAIEDAGKAIALADALSDGGLPVAEITFRTAAAAEVMAVLHKERPDFLVGAGTVLDRAALEACLASGAKFGLAPGFDPEIVDAAQTLGLPFAPGVMTPSEFGAAVKRGIRLMKFFPAGTIGGPPALDGIAAPFAHLGLRFIPTGGVSEANMGDWLKLKSVAAVGGTWIARPDDIAAGKWAEITAKARAAVEAAKRVRG
ncbi:MAG TPA: bifunctional 4-hydroxy-2-oxoglutarate aldolase/2-dehydro-3-deoxy-phosphogluconate aldolase [Lichenihabitans sp.]|jgi:2-dehydro-3-deoxyphosphogluconate aldolase/(4S)-4-hydroxy-2-oxoglutarate aldolase|nr:bifunctional 4-hydroxy-2-oxoglutarate aldolase/2-dehydro-3-deoxy-phosphogluconate aldolase [Lichenihabitans sp.]